MSLEYTIVCDECSRLIDASNRSAAVARQSVREMGGRVNLPGGRDICNQCVASFSGSGSGSATYPQGLSTIHKGGHRDEESVTVRRDAG